jgi:hypothetical protein
MSDPFTLARTNEAKICDVKTDQELKQRFGFISNPAKEQWWNFKQAIRSLELRLILIARRNKAYHNLCENLRPPSGTRQLLDIGLKFCLERKQLNQQLQHTLAKITHDIRLRFEIQENSEYFTDNSGENNPRLYIKSNFEPKRVNDHIELEIDNFAGDYKKFFNTHINPTRNLTFYQEHALEELQADPRFRIVPTDKNLGPAILEMLRYKQAIINEHLLSPSFKQIAREEVNEIINISKKKVNELTIEGAKLTAGEFVFLERAFKKPWRIAQLYGFPKIHKYPMKFRPIESQTNGPIEFCSPFFDSELQPILQSAPGYIIDPRHCQDDLERLDLPPNARLFTEDAISMYSNIDLNLGIASIRQWLEEETTTPQYRIDLTISLLTLVMKCNIFQFEDNFWFQLIGTSMGTSCAVTFATICFLLTESRICTKIAHRIPYFKRFIDDILGMWLFKNTVTNHEEDK